MSVGVSFLGPMTPISPAALMFFCSVWKSHAVHKGCTGLMGLPGAKAAKLQSLPLSLGGCQQFETFVKDNNSPCSLKICSGFEGAQGGWLWTADGNGLWKEGVGWKEGSRALVSWVHHPGCH